MFCTKCGNELEDGIFFCSKCGSMVSAPESHQQDDSKDAAQNNMNEEMNVNGQPMQAYQPLQMMDEAPQMQDSFSQQPVQPQMTDEAPQMQDSFSQQPVQPQMTNEAPQYAQPSPYAYNQMMQAPQAPQYAQQPVSIPVKPKKNKAPLVIGIVAAVAVIAALLIVFLKPSIDMLLNPEKQIKTALKQSSGQLMSVIDSSFTNNNLSKSMLASGNQEFTYKLKLDKATVNKSNFLTQLKADTFNANMQISPTDKVISGTMGIAVNESSKSEIEINFYMDSKNIYMNIPALCSKSFYISTEDVFDEIGIDYDMLFSYMGSGSSISSMMGGSAASMYSGVIQAAVKDVFSAVDTLIDELSYKKTGRITLSGDQGDVKATQFIIKITEQNIKNFAINVLENVYNDDSLKPLLGLAMTGTGIDKSVMRKNINSTNLGFDSIYLKAAVNNKKQLVAFSFDTDTIPGYKGERAEIEIKFVGKEDIYDCIGIGIAVEDFEINAMISENNNNNIKFTMSVKPDQTEYPGEYLSMVMDITADTSSSTSGRAVINEYSLKGLLDDVDVDVMVSGSIEYKTISSISRKKTDFKNPINYDRMTSSQEIEVAGEVMKNISVLKNILSDDIYNKLYRQLIN